VVKAESASAKPGVLALLFFVWYVGASPIRTIFSLPGGVFFFSCRRFCEDAHGPAR
jgi:hypothetical protein